MENRHKVLAIKFDVEGGEKKRCLCCLPTELLLIVLSYLSLIDYLSFRKVCKCWRSAFLLCSPFLSQEQTQSQLPFFMLLKLEIVERPLLCQTKQHFLRATGKFGDLSSRRVFSNDIPELSGAQILLSRHGWLLVFSSNNGSSSLFFLNPFSRARIDIPFLDITELESPVFQVSGPPTSPDCTVFAVSCDYLCMKASVCRRGEDTWTTHSSKYYWGTGVVVNVALVGRILYCLFKSGRFSAFDSANCCWRYLGPAEGMGNCFHVNAVSFVLERDNRTYLCVHGPTFYEVLLEEPLRVTRDFTDWDWQLVVEYLFRTSPENAFLRLRDQLEVDSFNARAWCAAVASGGQNEVAFRWHLFRSHVNERYCLDARSCLMGNKDCSTIVMWIRPSWLHPSPQLSWRL